MAILFLLIWNSPVFRDRKNWSKKHFENRTRMTKTVLTLKIFIERRCKAWAIFAQAFSCLEVSLNSLTIRDTILTASRNMQSR